MVKKQTRRQRDIKSKLLAAICMLLVSSIMMVSSTYAWFTLSTAPEVTGITTAVGANGNLEMALQPLDGNVDNIRSNAGDSAIAWSLKNTTWGNLVNLEDNTTYGLDKITLYPSALNTASGDDKLTTNTFLVTPSYGTDGRVSELVANTVTGVYDSNKSSFMPPESGEAYGVRAVGTASGMTDRQLSYRTARTAANTAMSMAKTAANRSLTTNGSALADMAIKHGLSETEETYTWAEISALATAIADLQGTTTDGVHTDGVLDYIETAYMQYLLAIAASSKTGTDDTVWNTVKTAVETDGADIDSVLSTLKSALATAGITDYELPTELSSSIAAYKTTVASVRDAATAMPDAPAADAEATTTYEWGDFSDALYALMNPDKMTVNTYTIAQVSADKQLLLDSFVEMQALVLTIATDGGVYADIADQCGDYQASIDLSIDYSAMNISTVATMKTATTVKPAYLTALGSTAEAAGAPTGSANKDMPLSEMYGYIIDLAFKTNAATSNLLLQVDAADRIYGDNSNEQTMGGGSSMTFKATVDGFSDQQVKDLMACIRIIFFDTTTGNIYATAKLDTANASQTGDGWEAKMYIYTSTTTDATYYTDDAGNYTDADGNIVVYVVFETTGEGDDAVTTTKYYTSYDADNDTYSDEIDETIALAKRVVENAAGSSESKEDNVIMELTQNKATALSVLVYLDGENISNADVAANAASSISGSMNLQFASSANLIPMEYAGLHTPNKTATAPEITETP